MFILNGHIGLSYHKIDKISRSTCELFSYLLFVEFNLIGLKNLFCFALYLHISIQIFTELVNMSIVMSSDVDSEEEVSFLN